MKKNILIIMLTVIAIFTMLYAFIKADEAKKAGMEASLSQQEVEKMRDQAVAFQEAAQESAAEAMRQKQLAEQALADCENQ